MKMVGASGWLAASWIGLLTGCAPRVLYVEAEGATLPRERADTRSSEASDPSEGRASGEGEEGASGAEASAAGGSGVRGEANPEGARASRVSCGLEDWCEGAGSADPEPRIAWHRVPRRGCIAPDAPRVEALRKEIEEQEEDAYQRALRERGVRPIELGTVMLDLHPGTVTSGGPPPPGADLPDLSGPLVWHRWEGRSRAFVLGERYWTGSASVPAPASFLLDPVQRIVYRVGGRMPQDDGRSVEVHLCGCSPRPCRYGSGCPACGATVHRLYGPLPEGVRFGGTIHPRYAAPLLRVHYVEGLCPNRCPPPPPRAPML